MEWLVGSAIGTTSSISLYWITNALTQRKSKWFWLGPALGMGSGAALMFYLDPSPAMFIFASLGAWGVASLVNLVVAYVTKPSPAPKLELDLPPTPPPSPKPSFLAPIFDGAYNANEQRTFVNIMEDVRAKTGEVVQEYVKRGEEFKDRVEKLKSDLKNANEEEDTDKGGNRWLDRLRGALRYIEKLFKKEDLHFYIRGSIVQGLETVDPSYVNETKYYSDVDKQKEFIDKVVEFVEHDITSGSAPGMTTQMFVYDLPATFNADIEASMENRAYAGFIGQPPPERIDVKASVRTVLEEALLIDDGRRPPTSIAAEPMRKEDEQEMQETTDTLREGAGFE